MIRAQGIIGSMAYSFDGERLRIVWFPSNDHFFAEVARGAAFKATVVKGWLETRRSKGRIEAIRARGREGYHRRKRRDRSLS